MVLGTDLTGKMAVVTGAGGILCGMFARTLARAGAAVALLDINLEAAEETARDIREAGGTAAAYGVDVMDKEMLESVHARVLARLGPCDILINGAGGNQARANTSKEYFEMGDIEADVATFFDMEYKGVQGVLDLNFFRRISDLPGLCQGYGGTGGMQYHQHLLCQRGQAPYQNTCIQRGRGRTQQFHPMAGRAFRKSWNPGQCHCSGFLCDPAE